MYKIVIYSEKVSAQRTRDELLLILARRLTNRPRTGVRGYKGFGLYIYIYMHMHIHIYISISI